MTVAIILLLLIVLLLTGMPLAFAMGVTTTVYLYVTGIDAGMLAQRMTASIDSFLILAMVVWHR